MFCLSLRPELKRFRAEFMGGEVRTFACIVNATLGRKGVTASALNAIPFLRPELEIIDIVVTPAQTVALLPKRARSRGGRHIFFRPRQELRSELPKTGG